MPAAAHMSVHLSVCPSPPFSDSSHVIRPRRDHWTITITSAPAVAKLEKVYDEYVLCTSVIAESSLHFRLAVCTILLYVLPFSSLDFHHSCF